MLSTLWAKNRYETDAVVRLDPWKDLGWNSWNIKRNRKWVIFFFCLSQRKEDSREWTQQHVVPIKRPVHRGGCLTTREPCNRGTEHLLLDVSAAHTHARKQNAHRPNIRDTKLEYQLSLFFVMATETTETEINRAVSGWDKEWVEKNNILCFLLWDSTHFAPNVSSSNA